ncbi:hypothetical protein DFH28DRAFT_892453 [Melampsora americana]|nr:hypothetical protein DFH28DRAFT_892453 [Melampsora americana]
MIFVFAKSSKPKVAHHLQFYPQVFSKGLVRELGHGKNWLSGLKLDLQAPMVHTQEGHSYLNEPLDLKDGRMVTPTHFYHMEEICMAKVLLVEVKDFPDGPCFLQIPGETAFADMDSVMVDAFGIQLPELHTKHNILLQKACGGCMYRKLYGHPKVIQLPNTWQIKSQGFIICHFPWTLYSNDTSGNISKQWNKCISYYIHMSGLPSNLSIWTSTFYLWQHPTPCLLQSLPIMW